MTRQTKLTLGGGGAIAFAFAAWVTSGRIDCTPAAMAELKAAAEQAYLNDDADENQSVERKYGVLAKVCAEQQKPLPPIPSSQAQEDN